MKIAELYRLLFRPTYFDVGEVGFQIFRTCHQKNIFLGRFHIVIGFAGPPFKFHCKHSHGDFGPDVMEFLSTVPHYIKKGNSLPADDRIAFANPNDAMRFKLTFG